MFKLVVGRISLHFWNANRPVALMARASDSKSGGWGFESLLACVEFLNGFKWFLNGE